MPLGEPSQTTDQPAARSHWATASAGKMCPPVPPAITIRVGAALMRATPS
jgi:hypothetical protein